MGAREELHRDHAKKLPNSKIASRKTTSAVGSCIDSRGSVATILT